MPIVSRIMIVAAILSVWGCGGKGPAPAPSGGYGDYDYGDYGYGAGEIAFLESAPANVTDVVELSDLEFTDASGKMSKVRDLGGEAGTVVVVTRGNTNPICPYCSTQTSHYIRDFDEFRRRGVEVALIYPIEEKADASRLETFLADAKTRLADPQRPIPFPVLFDVALTAVNQLGIRQDLSKPATYILDPAGHVRYAYVGAHLADRPAVAAIVKELDRLGIASPVGAEATGAATPVDAATPEPAPPPGSELN